MWTVTIDDLERLAIGAGILGTGGGGNPYLGKVHAKQLLKQGYTITVVSPDEVPDDAVVTSVGYMGAPVVSVERIKRGDEPLMALRALEKHIGQGVFDVVLANNSFPSKNAGPNTRYVLPSSPTDRALQRYQLHLADLTDSERPWRHDPEKLAKTLLALYDSTVQAASSPNAQTASPSSGGV